MHVNDEVGCRPKYLTALFLRPALTPLSTTGKTAVVEKQWNAFVQRGCICFREAVHTVVLLVASVQWGHAITITNGGG